MAGPSPWRLPSPQRGPDIGHSIWVHNRACWLNNSSPRSFDYNTTWTRNVKQGRTTGPSSKTVEACHEPDTGGSDRIAGAVARYRVRGPCGKRPRTAAVRGRRGAVRPPDHRGRAAVRVLIAQFFTASP